MLNKNLSLIQKLFIPSVFDLIVTTVFVTMIISSPKIICYDIWWHLRTGDLLLEGIFPTQDIFSFTAFGKPWILHEWGSEVLFALVYKGMGIPGLILLKSFLFALMFGLVFNMMLRRNINILICLAFTLILMVGNQGAWTVRPHMFTNLLLIVLLYIYIEFRHHKNQKMLRLLPLIFLIWINLHGGFIIGFIFLGICIFAEIITVFIRYDEERSLSLDECKKLIFYTIISFAVCFINPNTYKGVMYPLMYLGNQMDSHLISEWKPPTTSEDFEFFIILFFVMVAILFNNKKLFLYENFLILIFIFFALSAKRHISIFTLLAIPIVVPLWQNMIFSCCDRVLDIASGRLKIGLQKITEYFNSRSGWFSLMEKQLKCHTISILIISFFILLCGFKGEQLNIGLKTSLYPIEIIEYIKSNNINGNIFNPYSWGGFFIWSLPDKKVFIDGRMDVYKKEISDQYFSIINLSDGWEKLLEKHSIEHIVTRKGNIISGFLAKVSDEWIISKETDNAYFFSKK